MSELARLDGVTVRREKIVILDRVRATVPEGSVTAVIGPNGAGKTTLLLAMLGQVAYEGQIDWYPGQGRRPPRIGYVPQRLDFDRKMPITVAEFLAADQQRRPLWLGIAPAIRNKIQHSLDRVMAASLIDRPLGVLSGGELQRVVLALALLAEPELLLLDEPVSGVDVAGEKLFCDMLEDIQRKDRLTLLMVSHDLSVVSRHADHVICLHREVTCEGPTPQAMTAENLARLFGPHHGVYGHSHGHAHEHTHCGHDHVIPAPKSPGERV